MNSPVQTSFDITGRIDSDVLCAGCGHNVRGLLPNGACGECGLPVRWSIGGTTIGAADPAWLARIRSGVAIVACLLPWLIIPVFWPIFGLGLWRLSAPEPGGRRAGISPLYFGLRPLLVWGLCAFVPIAAFNDSDLAPGTHIEYILVLAAAFGLVILLTAFSLRQIALRARARRVAVWALVLGVIGAAGCLSWCGVVVLNRLMSATTTMDVEPLLACAGILGFLSLFGVIPLVMLLICVWRLLQRAEYESHGLRCGLKVWQGPTPGATWWPQVAASTDAATASGCRAGA